MDIISQFKKLFFKEKRIPLLVIAGPTATGKTALSIQIAKERLALSGVESEIISADSRQVYRGLDIGTAKITEKEKEGIPHHMIDIVDPDDVYSVADFKAQAQACIRDIHERGKLPILVGGTGMYIDAVINNRDFPAVPANEDLRAELSKLSLEDLQKKLQALNPERYETIDQQNPVRLIRAIEISLHCHPEFNSSLWGSRLSRAGSDEPLMAKQIPDQVRNDKGGVLNSHATSFSHSPSSSRSPCEALTERGMRGSRKARPHRPLPGGVKYNLEIIYLDVPDEELRTRIHQRNVERLENGLIEEVEKLHKNGLSWERMYQLGLEYRYVSDFLQEKISTKEELLEILDNKIWQFAKRQRTWFKKYLK